MVHEYCGSMHPFLARIVWLGVAEEAAALLNGRVSLFVSEGFPGHAL